MRNLNRLLTRAFFCFSSIVLSARPAEAAIEIKTFDAQASVLLGSFGLRFGVDESRTIGPGQIVIGGKTTDQVCQVVVSNSTYINPSSPFPNTSKAEQNVHVTVIANPGPNATGSTFKLHRTKSRVTLVEQSKSAGLGELRLAAINPTGIGNGTSHQYLTVQKRTNVQRTLIVNVIDGTRKYTCQFQTVRRQ